ACRLPTEPRPPGGPATPRRDVRPTPWPPPGPSHFVPTAFGSVRLSVSTPRLGDPSPSPRLAGPLGASEGPHRSPHERWSSLTSSLLGIRRARVDTRKMHSRPTRTDSRE